MLNTILPFTSPRINVNASAPHATFRSRSSVCFSTTSSHYASQFGSQVPTSHYAVPYPSISHHPSPAVYSSNLASIQATASFSSLEAEGPGTSSCEDNDYMNGQSTDRSTQHFFHPSGAFCDRPAVLAKPGKPSSHRNCRKGVPAHPYVRFFKCF